MRTRIRSVGVALPKGRLSNAEIAGPLNVTPAWIATRTGIESRRVVTPGEDIITLAVRAAGLALAEAGERAVDLVVAATVTPAEATPSLASRVQQALGLGGPAWDVSAACAGFIYALANARAMLLAGHGRRALVVGADVLSTRVDPLDRGTAILFADGAGAVVLERVAGEGPGIVAVALDGDATHADALRLREVVEMEGLTVYRQAARHLGGVVERVCADAGWVPSDIDVLVPHQANRRLLDAVARRLELPPERLVCDIERVGNTSAASIPVALAHALRAGRIRSGHRVVLVGLGAGMVWGAVAMRW